MATTSINSHLFPLYIQTGVDTWTEVDGLNNLDLKPSSKTADGTTFKNRGWTQDVVVSRGLEISAKGLAYVDKSTGVKDAGQAAVEALGLLDGEDCIGVFRITLPADKAWEFSAAVATVSAYNPGAVDGLTAWEAELKVTTAPEVVSTLGN